MQNKSDEALVKLYLSGDEAAFNELYSRYKNLVKFYCRNLYLLGAESEDLIQEGMFGLIKAVNGYKDGAGTFKSYASVCIKTSILNAVKKFAGKKNGPLNESSDIGVLDALGFFYHTPEETIVDKERGDELKLKIYAALTKNEILVLSLYLSGLTYAEIAEKLNKTEKAVDGALFRARKKIINVIGA